MKNRKQFLATILLLVIGICFGLIAAIFSELNQITHAATYNLWATIYLAMFLLLFTFLAFGKEARA